LIIAAAFHKNGHAESRGRGGVMFDNLFRRLFFGRETLERDTNPFTIPIPDQTPERWNKWIRAHWRIENGSHYVRDTAFAEDASRIRKNPDIAARLRSFAYNLIRADGAENVRNARWRAALDLNFVLGMPNLI
jgi:hypothetical protein